MEKKPTKKKTGTRGINLWNVNLVHQFMSSPDALWIVTRSRNIETAAKKATITIRRFYAGRRIDSIKHRGTLDN